MLTKQRLFVHLYVTPICNLRCKHCYYDAIPIRSDVGHILSIEDCALIIIGLCEAYDAYFDVEGGEFYLRKDIDQLFALVPSIYWNRITITSNGTIKIRTDPSILQQLDEFRISVEGHTDDLQREIRGVELAPVLNTCVALRSAGVPVTLRITLHKKNYLELMAMLNRFMELGFSRFSLYEFQATGRGRDCETEYALSDGEIQHVVKELVLHPIKKRDASVKLSLSARRVSIVSALEKQLISSNYSILRLTGAASLTINYDGSFGICPWQIGSDSIGVFHPDTFLVDIRRFVTSRELYHVCNHCSDIRIRN